MSRSAITTCALAGYLGMVAAHAGLQPYLREDGPPALRYRSAVPRIMDPVPLPPRMPQPVAPKPSSEPELGPVPELGGPAAGVPAETPELALPAPPVPDAAQASAAAAASAAPPPPVVPLFPTPPPPNLTPQVLIPFFTGSAGGAGGATAIVPVSFIPPPPSTRVPSQATYTTSP